MEQTQDNRGHDRLAAALQYARQGWRIFPCKGKKPLVDDWEHQASNNLVQIQAWWARWADANLGLPAGANGYVVVDVDPGHGGAETLRLLAEQGFELNTGLRAETGTGGLHLYFKHPANGERVKSNAGMLGEGLDIRADGGYVVLAPSVHPDTGQRYRWLSQGEASEMPAWVNLTNRGAPRPGTRREEHPNGSGPLSEGGRNVALAREAGRLRAAGYSPQALAIALNAYNQDHCVPPLSVEEVNQVAASVGRYDPGQIEPYETTDVGNSRRLIDTFGNEIRFVLDQTQWLCWDGARWFKNEADLIERAKLVCRDMIAEVPQINDDHERARRAKHAAGSQNIGKLRAMVETASSVKQIRIDQTDMLDADPWLFNCANGTVNLRSGLLQDHNSDDLITKVARVRYDSHAKAPTWIAFLHRIFQGKAELIDYVQRLCGYTMTGLTTEQQFWFLYGTGANGKSTFVNTVREVLGEYAIQADSGVFLSNVLDSSTSNAMAKLVGSRFVSASETEGGKKFNVVRLKQMTGGEPVEAKILYHDLFMFTPICKILITGNSQPETNSFDEGLIRRLRLIPFLETIPTEEQDQELIEKLKKESSGIFNWLVQGCLKWQQQPLRIREPLEVTGATKEYWMDMDEIGEFIGSRCKISETQKCLTEAFYKAYSAWQESRGRRPESYLRFVRRLKERNLPGVEHSRRRDGKSELRGIGLVDATTSPVDVEI